MDNERRNLIRAHEWIRLYPGRELGGHDVHGVYWHNPVTRSTRIVLWAEVERDLKDAWLKKFKTDMRNLTDPTKENHRHG